MFIDTEASGLPRNWNAPYAQAGNWPFAVQISWILYTKEGQPVKWANHYIKDNDFEISPSALKIHGITREFLLQHGESRQEILLRLAADIRQFEPLVVGHFMEFDALVLGAEFYRTGLENPLTDVPTFCTMPATTGYVRNPRLKYLRLGDLYHTLFNTTLDHQHNALVDARATADCFFELLRRGDIDAGKILEQQLKPAQKEPVNKKLRYTILVLILFLSAILLYYWL